MRFTYYTEDNQEVCSPGGESVGMCRPLDPPFSPQVHPLVGYSDVKHTLVGHHFFCFEPIFLGNICEIFTLFGSLSWKYDTLVGVKIHPADTPVGWKFTPRTPHPYLFWGEIDSCCSSIVLLSSATKHLFSYIASHWFSIMVPTTI